MRRGSFREAPWISRTRFPSLRRPVLPGTPLPHLHCSGVLRFLTPRMLRPLLPARPGFPPAAPGPQRLRSLPGFPPPVLQSHHRRVLPARSLHPQVPIRARAGFLPMVPGSTPRPGYPASRFRALPLRDPGRRLRHRQDPGSPLLLRECWFPGFPSPRLLRARPVPPFPGSQWMRRGFPGSSCFPDPPCPIPHPLEGLPLLPAAFPEGRFLPRSYLPALPGRRTHSILLKSNTVSFPQSSQLLENNLMPYMALHKQTVLILV